MNHKINDNNSIEKLTNDEQYALSYLRSTDIRWANAFEDILLESRDKISQRLITSLHRENLVQSRHHSEIIKAQNLNLDVAITQPFILKITFPEAKKLYMHLFQDNMPLTESMLKGRFILNMKII
ncbi:hypothetical protein SD419_06650 [Staphylococcus pseudoxylosus]|nr:hypothetical protein [Staphylococcus pseudoxylosus]